MAKFVAPPLWEGNFLEKLKFLYISRAAALCVVALVVFFSSCHRPASQSDGETQDIICRDSLPIYVQQAYTDGDARACYIVASAIYQQYWEHDSFPGLEDLTFVDAKRLLLHAADEGYAPAIRTIVCLLENNVIHLSQEEKEYWIRLANESVE